MQEKLKYVNRQALLFAALVLMSVPEFLFAVDHLPQWTYSHTCRYNLPGEGYGSEYVSETDVGDYAFCRFGNFLSAHSGKYAYESETLTFNNLTVTTDPLTNSEMDNPYAGGLFVMGGINNIYFTEPQLHAVNWKDKTSTSVGSIDVQSYLENNNYIVPSLYRYFTMTDGQLPGIEATTKKYVILIHGWNPDSRANCYQAQSPPPDKPASPERFAQLSASLQSWVTRNTASWKVLQYHMEADTDTGDNGMTVAARNGTEAAEIARLHGYHMAQLILSKCPSIQSVHLVAHSAGSWAARSCAQYLLDNNSLVIVQMTLLDAFIPGELAGNNSSLNKALMEGTSNFASSSRFKLDNYVADNAVIFGTDERFDWGANELPHGDVVTSDYGQDEWSDHAGPIKYYADSVDNVYVSTYPGGWKTSLAFNDLKPMISGITPSKLNALPLPQSQLIRITGSGFTSSSRLTFNGGVNNEYTDRIPTTWTPEELTYNIVVGPYAGNWTVRVMNNGISSDEYAFSVESSATLSSLSITGSASINEGGNGQYTATAMFTDGSSSTVNPLWSVSGAASISSLGVLSAGSVTANSTVSVSASFTSGGITKSTTKSVTIIDIPGGGGGGGGLQEMELIKNGDFAEDGANWSLFGNFQADHRFPNSYSAPG